MPTDLQQKKYYPWIVFSNISGPPSLVVLLGLRLAPAQRLHCTSVRRMGRGGAFLAQGSHAQRAEVQQSQPAIGVASAWPGLQGFRAWGTEDEEL